MKGNTDRSNTKVTGSLTLKLNKNRITIWVTSGNEIKQFELLWPNNVSGIDPRSRRVKIESRPVGFLMILHFDYGPKKSIRYGVWVGKRAKTERGSWSKSLELVVLELMLKNIGMFSELSVSIHFNCITELTRFLKFFNITRNDLKLFNITAY